MKMYDGQKTRIEEEAANMIAVKTRNDDVTETVTVSHKKFGIILSWTRDHHEKGYCTIDKDLVTPIAFTKSLSLISAAFLAAFDQEVADLFEKDRKNLQHYDEDFKDCWQLALAATGAAGFRW